MSHAYQSPPPGSGGVVLGSAKTLSTQAEALTPILDRMAEALVILDASGRPVFASAAAQRILGTGPPLPAAGEWLARFGFYLGEGEGSLCPPEKFPPLRALRGEPASQMDLFLKSSHRSGGQPVTMQAVPVREAAAGTFGAVVVFREIGESRPPGRERGLAAALLHTVPSLVVVLDSSARIVKFNRACELATGYQFEEVAGKPVWQFLVPEEAEQVRKVFASLSAGNLPNQHENYWVAKDGSRRRIAWSNTALLDSQGRAEYIIGSGYDVTEQRRTEAELRQANQTLAAVIRTSPLAIVRLDLQGRVVYWNPAATQMFGWTEEEVRGKLFPIVPEDDLPFFWANIERARWGETLSGVERQRKRKDGTLIDVALWNAVQHDSNGETVGVISVIADMTERRRLEEQFRQSQKMEAVGRLAGGVAHDFNNLLTIITGYGQMILEGLALDDPVREQVQEVLNAADSAAALTNQLLAFSRRQVVQPQIVDLNGLVAGMDKMLHRLIGEDIDLVTSLSPRLPKVKVDPGQFQQVVLNLVVNARDALPEGGRIRIQTTASQKSLHYSSAPGPEGLCVLLSVEDNGRGMTDDTKLHLFEPFFTTKGKGKGTGLGLSTVYGIVKQAGGEIFFESEAGRGTTFRICLPAVEEVQAAAARSGPALERQRGTETVLLVEDEAGLRKLIREVLETNGYTVLEAASHHDALQLCEAHLGPIHLILTDIVMPQMSGRDLAQRVTAMRPQLRVLYMSGYTDHVMLDQPAAQESFLQKPFTPELLLRKVREVLEAAEGR